MTKEEALALALNALHTNGEHHPRVYEAIAAIQTVLAQPAQETDILTVAYQSGYYDGKKAAQRTWVGLTDEEIHALPEYSEDRIIYRLIRTAEAKLKEKNA
jgi:hypothetical protein